MDLFLTAASSSPQTHIPPPLFCSLIPSPPLCSILFTRLSLFNNQCISPMIYHYYYCYVALSFFQCHISLSLCFLSCAARVLGCFFFPTHSPPIFITQRTNTTTYPCQSLSLSPFLALPVSPLSNSLSKWGCS